MKSYDRTNKRYVFVNNNIHELLKLNKHKDWYDFARNPIVNMIAEKARTYIGYSVKTYNADICWTLYNLALKLHKENLKYQLKFNT